MVICSSSSSSSSSSIVVVANIFLGMHYLAMVLDGSLVIISPCACKFMAVGTIHSLNNNT